MQMLMYSHAPQRRLRKWCILVVRFGPISDWSNCTRGRSFPFNENLHNSVRMHLEGYRGYLLRYNQASGECWDKDEECFLITPIPNISIDYIYFEHESPRVQIAFGCLCKPIGNYASTTANVARRPTLLIVYAASPFFQIFPFLVMK